LTLLKSLNWKLVNWWVWLETRICYAWLKLPLGAVFENDLKKFSLETR